MTTNLKCIWRSGFIISLRDEFFMCFLSEMTKSEVDFFPLLKSHGKYIIKVVNKSAHIAFAC